MMLNRSNYAKYFRKVDIESMDINAILSHIAKPGEEADLLHAIKDAVYCGHVKPFWVPYINPSLDPKTKQIIFEENAKPCVMATKLWNAEAELFWPERGSRLANKYERAIYTAYIIDSLTKKGTSEQEVWKIATKNKKEAISEYEDTTMLKITLTEGKYELWDVSKKLFVDYQFIYCEQASGLVILTKD